MTKAVDYRIEIVNSSANVTLGKLKNLTVDIDRRAVMEVTSLFEQEKYEQAAKTADKISDVNQRVKVLSSIVEAQVIANQGKSAVATAQKILKLKPKDYLSLYYLGLSYSTIKDLKNAEKYLLASIKAKANNRATLNTLGTVYIDLKNTNKAIEYLQKAIAIEPSNAKAYANLGMVYFDSNKYDQALETYVNALYYNSNTPVLADSVVAIINYRIAYIYMYMQGNNYCTKAVPYLNTVLKYYPDDKDTLFLLDQCPKNGTCFSGAHVEDSNCVSDMQLCDAGGVTGEKNWNGTGYGPCIAVQ